MFKSIILLHFTSFPFPLILYLTIYRLFLVSCRWWGKHYGPLATGRLLPTSAHYPGDGSRDPFGTLQLACLNGKFFTPDGQLTSLVTDWVIPGVFNFNSCFTLRGLYWIVPWEPLALSMVPLVLVNGLHHLPIIRKFSIMLDLNTSIRMLEFVLWSVGFKTPNSDHICSGCVDWFMITWLIDGWLRPYLSLHGWLRPYLYHYNDLISGMAAPIPQT